MVKRVCLFQRLFFLILNIFPRLTRRCVVESSVACNREWKKGSDVPCLTCKDVMMSTVD